MAQLTAAAFQTFDPNNVGSIPAGPFSLYAVSLSDIAPTQMNEGFAEVGSKISGWDLQTAAQVQATLLQDIEPVVIGPGGKLFLLNGHHTFTSLSESVWGATNPTVYVNVVANFSNLTTSQFWQAMANANLVLPLNDGATMSIDPLTGNPIPSNLLALSNDAYRGLEYSILKNKSSVLFPTTGNLTGAVGAATPGLDKMNGFYADFIWAEAYRNANSGLGLAYLSPGDIALAAQWNLNGASTTMMPGVGTVHVYQLPGFILGADITISTTIDNAALASGTLDGNGTFTGITSFNFGGTILGTVQSGFVMQLGADAGHVVNLTGTNSYTGGTTILAGTLVVASDAALGAAAPSGYAIDPNNLVASIEAANGIIFNSLSEGAAKLRIGPTAGGGTATFATNRAIGVNGETAVLDPNGYIVTLSGSIVSVGSNGVGLGSATGESDLSINDSSSGAKGVVIVTGNNAGFYGNWVVSAGTLRISSDAALGNTTGASYTIGQIDLDGGIFQAGGSFTSVRSLFLTGGSTFDTAGYTTSFSGSVTDVQRTLTVTNSSTTSAGAVTFGSFVAGDTAQLALTGGTKGETVTLTGGFVRQGNAAVMILPSSATSLGNTEKVFATTAPTLTNGIVAPWIASDNGGTATTNPYDFVTYGANGFVKATYTKTGSGASGGIRAAGATDIVEQNGNATLAANASAYALKLDNGFTITATGYTITLGNGSGQAGLILEGAAAITGGTLAFGGAEAVIDAKATNTISAAIGGSGGLTLNGSGTLTLSAVSAATGAINVNSGTLSLTTANVFGSDAAGLTLANVKSKPSAAILNFTANQSFTALNSAGNNSSITFSNGAALTIGDTTNNLASTISSTITETGSAVAGAITKNGSGLLDLSGVSTGKLTLVSGSTIAVGGGALRLYAKILANANNVTLANGAEVQFAENAGDVYSGNVTGAGDLRLIGGTLKLTGTGNSYTGGTFVEAGSTLLLTTANVSSGNANIGASDATVDFDQTTNGTYAGVLSDEAQMGTGAVMAATLIKDDSTGANSGTLTLTQTQAFSGYTYVEAGGLDLAHADTLKASAGVVLGRVGGGATASLTLDANNQLASLADTGGNTTSVALDGHVLTLAEASGTSAMFSGIIKDGSVSGGALVFAGAGSETLAGADSFTGGVTLESGTLDIANAAAAGTSTIAFAAGASATLKIEAGDTPSNTISGFAAGDTIDLAGTALDAAGGAVLGNGNALTVTENGHSTTLHLNAATSYVGEVFHVSSDGNGGIDVQLEAAPTLAINGAAPLVGPSGEASVAFTVSGLVSGDSGTVIFTDSAGHSVSVNVAAGTNTYSANLSSLSDGSITSTLTLSGNGFSATGNTVTLDTTAPTVAITSADGLITNQALQTISGTVDVADAGTWVTVYENSVALGYALVQANGTWSTQVSFTGDGAHTLVAKDVDAAGNIGTSNAVHYTLDTVAPSVAITTAGSLTNQATQTVAGTVDVADAGTTVSVYENSVVLGTATVASDGTWSTSVTLAGDGTHTLVARDSDAAGNTGSSTPITYTLDTAPPAAPSALSVTSAANGYINAANDIAGQALTGSAEAGAAVAVYDNGALLGTTSADGSGHWSFTLGVLADGSTHAYAATATDAAGNTGAASGALGITVDLTPPATPGRPTESAAHSYYVNASTNTASQTLYGSADAGTTITVYDNGTAIGTAVADATTGAWSNTLGVLSEGAHSFTVTASDAAGNTSAASAAFHFTVDTIAPVAPTLADSAIINGYVNAAHDTVAQTITGTAEAGASVLVYDGTKLIATVKADSVTGVWSYKIGKLADGTHSVTATATDAAGNTGVASAALAFTVDTTPPAAPTLLADAGIVSQVVNAAADSAAQTLTGHAEAGSTITVIDSGKRLGTTTADGSGAWSYTIGKLANGAHSLTATAADTAGNVSAASTALAFTVDITPPVAPTALADAAIVSGYVNAAHDTAAQALTGTAVAGALVSVYDGTRLLGTTYANGAGAWSYALGVLADGGHALTATATDAVGNTGKASAALKFKVDTAAPAAPTGLTDTHATGGGENAKTDTAAQTVTGSAEAGSVVSVYDNGTLLGTVKASAGGTWGYKLGVLADGAHSLTATATDAAGNTGSASAALSFLVDTVAPGVPVVTNVTVGTGTFTVTGTGEANSIINFKGTGVAEGSTRADASGNWSFTASTINSPSVYRATLTQQDGFGNVGSASGQIIFAGTSKTLIGTSANDILLGGAGDTLTGGAGNDVFAFHAGFGKETVTDFAAPSGSVAGDVLQFDQSVFADWAHLLGATKQQGTDLLITLDASDVITLKNVSLASFTQASARFVGAGLSN